jgi:hypothetical protein
MSENVAGVEEELTPEDGQSEFIVRPPRSATLGPRLLAAVLLILLAAAFLLYRQTRPNTAAPAAVERALQAQRELPREAVRALQDLRLVAAVQLSYKSAKGRFGSVEELQSAGFLDPKWPRARNAYQVSCGPEPHGQAFTCFADPLPPHRIYFRIDATQAVRYETGRRPNGSSPIFGLSREDP